MDDLIDEQLAAGDPTPRMGGPAYAAFPSCRWCKHNWHGLSCDTCPCESAMTARDDSWRPRDTHSRTERQLLVMHETGCDGWVAVLASAVTVRPGCNPGRIRAALYGRVA